MLHQETIRPEAFELLKKLCKEPFISDFALAGGTALSLILGHRISVDLDFFTLKSFDPEYIHLSLLKYKYKVDKDDIIKTGNTLNCQIDNVKVQFLGHLYKQLRPTEEAEGVRLYSLEDITAMKVNAVCNRGAKKDFWDLNELLKNNDLSKLIDLFKEKYDIDNIAHVLASLSYFQDAERDNDPIVIKKISWTEVKQNINKHIQNYLTVSIKNQQTKNQNPDMKNNKNNEMLM